MLLNYAIGKYLENNSCSTSGSHRKRAKSLRLWVELVVDGNLPAVMGLAKKILSLCNRRDRKGTKKMIDFLQKHNLMKTRMTCKSCKKSMKLQKTHTRDGYQW